MDPLTSHIDPASADFRANRERMLALVQEHRDRVAQARLGGGPKYSPGIASKASYRCASASRR